MNDYFDAGGGYQWGMRYEPGNLDVMNAVLGVNQHVESVGAQLQEGMSELIKKVDTTTRKKRKSCVSRQIVTLQDGRNFLLYLFDDNSQEGVPLMVNVRGAWKVYRLCLKERYATEFFCIYFLDGQNWVIGRRDKVKKGYLYECFIKAGVIFNSQIARSTIAEVLFEFLAPAIEQTENTLTICANAGWFQGEFYHAENFPFAKEREFSGLPVLKRRLKTVEPYGGCWGQYFREMNRITRWEDRIIISLFPFLALMRSIIREEQIERVPSLNFVRANDLPVETICSWLQTYNRSEFCPVLPIGSEKDWIALLGTYKDEVLIVDFSMTGGETGYEEKKMMQRWEKTREIISGKVRVPELERNVCDAVVVSFTKKWMFYSDVYNIILDEESYCNISVSTKGSKAIECVMSAFISYLKKNMSSVRTKIRSGKEKRSGGLQIIWEIIRNFWLNEGIPVEQSLKLPENINFKEIIEENGASVDELLKVFIRAVRKEARNFCFMKKRDSKTLSDGEVLCDENYIWIMPMDLQNILRKNGLEKYTSRILLELKLNGSLKTESDRLTKKIQLGNTRKAVYQIKKEIFNELGMLDISELGKERSKSVCVIQKGTL